MNESEISERIEEIANDIAEFAAEASSSVNRVGPFTHAVKNTEGEFIGYIRLPLDIAIRWRVPELREQLEEADQLLQALLKRITE